jgi:hypothetical protein
MMGVITEDNKNNVIRKMIDEIGIMNTIKMVGNYYAIEPYLEDVDKVNYIRKKVSELGKGGVSFFEMDEEPILVYKNGNNIKQIEFLGRDRAYINIYHRNSNLRC